jgi:osomolarity two-component system response regulator SKN7
MEAVGLVNQDPDRYHLVFMDIIMPNLDGVSAATCIRSEYRTGVPIVAMTSNIRQEDIATYFNFGKCDSRYRIRRHALTRCRAHPNRHE